MLTSTVEIAMFVVFLAVFVALYYTTAREPAAYAVRCAAFLALLVYLVQQMF